MAAYYEDNEWCYRVEQGRPGSFRRSLEARAVHHFTPQLGASAGFAARSLAIELLYAHARFYQRHGVLLGSDLFVLVPELRDGDGGRDLAAARVLMELLLAKGTDWTMMEWINGNLGGLLGGRRRLAEQEHRLVEQERRMAEQAGQLELLHARSLELDRVVAGGWWRLRQRLLPALRILWRVRGREGS